MKNALLTIFLLFACNLVWASWDYRGLYNMHPSVYPSEIQFLCREYAKKGIRTISVTSGQYPTKHQIKKAEKDPAYSAPRLMKRTCFLDSNGWKEKEIIYLNDRATQIKSFTYQVEGNKIKVQVLTQQFSYMGEFSTLPMNEQKIEIVYTDSITTLGAFRRPQFVCQYHIDGTRMEGRCEQTPHYNKYSSGGNTTYTPEYNKDGIMIKEVIKQRYWRGGSCVVDVEEAPELWFLYKYDKDDMVKQVRVVSGKKVRITRPIFRNKWFDVSYGF